MLTNLVNRGVGLITNGLTAVETAPTTLSYVVPETAAAVTAAANLTAAAPSVASSAATAALGNGSYIFGTANFLNATSVANATAVTLNGAVPASSAISLKAAEILLCTARPSQMAVFNEASISSKAFLVQQFLNDTCPMTGFQWYYQETMNAFLPIIDVATANSDVLLALGAVATGAALAYKVLTSDWIKRYIADWEKASNRSALDTIDKDLPIHLRRDAFLAALDAKIKVAFGNESTVSLSETLLLSILCFANDHTVKLWNVRKEENFEAKSSAVSEAIEFVTKIRTHLMRTDIDSLWITDNQDFTVKDKAFSIFAQGDDNAILGEASGFEKSDKPDYSSVFGCLRMQAAIAAEDLKKKKYLHIDLTDRNTSSVAATYLLAAILWNSRKSTQHGVLIDMDKTDLVQATSLSNVSLHRQGFWLGIFPFAAKYFQGAPIEVRGSEGSQQRAFKKYLEKCFKKAIADESFHERSTLDKDITRKGGMRKIISSNSADDIEFELGDITPAVNVLKNLNFLEKPSWRGGLIIAYTDNDDISMYISASPRTIPPTPHMYGNNNNDNGSYRGSHRTATTTTMTSMRPQRAPGSLTSSLLSTIRQSSLPPGGEEQANGDGASSDTTPTTKLASRPKKPKQVALKN